MRHTGVHVTGQARRPMLLLGRGLQGGGSHGGARRAGEDAVAAALHSTGVEASGYTSNAFQGKLDALRAKDQQESIDVAQTMKQVIENMGKAAYKKEASDFIDPAFFLSHEQVSRPHMAVYPS